MTEPYLQQDHEVLWVDGLHWGKCQEGRLSNQHLHTILEAVALLGIDLNSENNILFSLKFEKNGPFNSTINVLNHKFCLSRKNQSIPEVPSPSITTSPNPKLLIELVKNGTCLQ